VGIELHKNYHYGKKMLNRLFWGETQNVKTNNIKTNEKCTYKNAPNSNPLMKKTIIHGSGGGDN